MKRALVTGATGFIGQHLCRRLLSEGFAVRAMVRAQSSSQPLREMGVELFAGDLENSEFDPDMVRGVETVFHLGGTTTTPDLGQLRHINVHGTDSLLRAITKSDLKPNFVYVSSIAASGPASGNKIRTVEDSPQPISNYGTSKYQAEQVVNSYAGQLPVSIVRPGLVFGPGDVEGFRLVEPIAKFGIHVTIGYRTPPLSVIHVQDLVEILFRVGETGQRVTSNLNTVNERAGGIYIAAAHGYPTYRRWGQLIGSLLNRNVRVVPLSKTTGYAVGWCAGRLHCGVFHVDKIREALVDSWAYRDDRVAKQLGFQPAKPIKQRLAETLAWYHQVGWL